MVKDKKVKVFEQGLYCEGSFRFVCHINNLDFYLLGSGIPMKHLRRVGIMKRFMV